MNKQYGKRVIHLEDCCPRVPSCKLFSTEIHQHLRTGLVSFDCCKDQQVLQVPVFASKAVVISVGTQSLAEDMVQALQAVQVIKTRNKD